MLMHAEYLDLNILIIDDDEDDYFITSEYIRSIPGNRYVIDWCFKYDEALKLTCDNKYDLFLIDYLLGAQTGLDLIKDAISRNCEQPFILLTGKGNRKVDVEAMEAGAFDYLVKSEMDAEKLERCIRYTYERSRSLKALRANERKFRNVFERSADAVFLTNASLQFLDVNDATVKLFGYSREELLQSDLVGLLLGGVQQQMLLDELLKCNDIENKEVVLKTKHGLMKYCTLSVSAEHDHDKRYYQFIMHDITGMKKAEKATLRMEKKGVAGRLVHVLAHEVRNPLNNINLSLEQLDHQTPAEESKIYLDIIQRNCKRIESLITELLDTSRPADIQRVPVSLQQVIRESIASAHDRITLKKIRLNTELPDTEIMVMADPEKLRIAFLNIIINAVEAMEQSEGVLQINLDNANGQLQLTISDNGCGISDENLSRLFEPYFTAKRNGMGLGLATTLNILQSHNMDVEVQSILNEGSKFIISLNDANEQLQAV
jgi:PAS domain S-box-containing protein